MSKKHVTIGAIGGVSVTTLVLLFTQAQTACTKLVELLTTSVPTSP